MKDSIGSIELQGSPTAPRDASAVPVSRVRRWMFLSIASAAAVLICCSHAAAAGANTIRASGIGYLAFSLVLFGCASTFWTRARSTTGALYVRWSMISAATVTAAMGYLPSFTQAYFGTSPARQFQTSCFNASEALYLLAAVLFFAGVSRPVVILDTLQAFLFVVIRFKLIYSPVTRDHFALNHLLIGQLVALCLLVVATIGCLGAASRAELIFLRTLSWFLGARLLAFFLSNQVSYTWLHYTNCSLWDVPGTAFLSAFALYLLYTDRPGARSRDALLRAPSVAVRSLMPSFLALLNLMLALFALRVSIEFAETAIFVSLVSYVVRTVMMQSQAVHEKTLLQNRNEHLEGLAVRDPLTGIGNRRSLAQVYGRMQTFNEQKPFCLLLMDIDHFKQANDSHGHLHGDEVLVALARELQQISEGNPGSHCARFGGDEFALLLSGVTKLQSLQLANELRALLAARTFSAGRGGVSLSIGVASAQQAIDMPIEAIIAEADQALYRAKTHGRNRVEVQPEAPSLEAGASLQTPRPRLQLQHDAN